jgi:PAS domain S-box-containing protein
VGRSGGPAGINLPHGTSIPRNTGTAGRRMAPRRHSRSPRYLSPLTIAAAYLLVGTAWIFLSDRALTLLFPAGELARWQTVKGILYVAVTALLLFLLMRRSLAALRRSEERHRQMFETTTVALLIDPATATIEDANAAAEAFYGWPREELAGRPLAEINTLPPEEIARAVERVLAGQRAHFLFQHRVRGGELRDVEVFSSVIETRGRPLIYSILYDRTEARRVEEQLRQAQKMETLGQLTGGMAHDLNNVLSVILGNAELMRQELPDGRDDLQNDLGELTAAARRGAAMIRKVAGFSRTGPLEAVVLDLAAGVRDTAETLRQLIPAGIEVVIGTPAEPVPVRADRGALEQILMNLVTNARDAMPEGGRLEIQVGKSGGTGAFTVRDTGIGMDEATRARILEPFFTTKPPPLGTGLGMAMVDSLVRRQGGTLAIGSAPGRGTTVTVALPLAERRAAERAAAGPLEALPRGTETILIVEDEAGLRRAARRLLERLGYTVLDAADGEAALAILRERGPAVDLVLSDLVMPRLGGRALYDAARREGVGARFVFSSGYGGEVLEGLETVDDQGPALIRKPWALDELAAKLREVLDA